ncbi:MAG TPA: hypothetical protein VI916_04095 [Acidimicrobiia bacterium]|nr:hypothetical protein [Acidimicrobiia bacterium]
MPSARTLITEIATGLGCTSFDSVESALAERPREFVNVTSEAWSALDEEWARPSRRVDFEGAFANGRALFLADDGMRGRPVRRIEWKGSQRAPAYEFLPADLRIDHVFLVSCKYDSRVVGNTSPAHLFDDLQWGRIEAARDDWYQIVAPVEYQRFYEAAREASEDRASLPALVGGLGAADRATLKAAFGRTWPPILDGPYREFSFAVAKASAARWEAATSTQGRRELALWRLLRMGAAPYFLLGESGGERLRLRVATPWDWQQSFKLQSFAVAPARAEQPRVDWEARIQSRSTREVVSVVGHVEVRWSHGRFAQPPEAKVYLDTPHHRVPGYFPLV